MFALCSRAFPSYNSYISERTGPRPWTADDKRRLVIRIGLQKGLGRVRARRVFGEDEQRTIAGEILDHLRLSNYRIASADRSAATPG
jgi:hypothetical protein